MMGKHNAFEMGLSAQHPVQGCRAHLGKRLAVLLHVALTRRFNCFQRAIQADGEGI
jgi:hypothetical protein